MQMLHASIFSQKPPCGKLKLRVKVIGRPCTQAKIAITLSQHAICLGQSIKQALVETVGCWLGRLLIAVPHRAKTYTYTNHGQVPDLAQPSDKQITITQSILPSHQTPRNGVSSGSTPLPNNVHVSRSHVFSTQFPVPSSPN